MAPIRRQLPVLHSLDDVGQRGVPRRGHAYLLALIDDKPVEELDLRATTFDHVLAHRRPMPAAAGFARFGEAVVIILGLRAHIALASARNQLGGKVANLLELIAERLADPDRLAANSSTEMAQSIVEQNFATEEAGASREAVCHGVDHELCP